MFLPGKSHGQRSLAGYSPWGRKKSDKTERLTHFIVQDVQTIVNCRWVQRTKERRGLFYSKGREVGRDCFWTEVLWRREKSGLWQPLIGLVVGLLIGWADAEQGESFLPPAGMYEVSILLRSASSHTRVMCESTPFRASWLRFILFLNFIIF